jgi:hypothetical protein
MSDCCVKSVPQSDSSYETFGQPVMDWMARLTAGLNRSIPNINQTMGDLERQILQETQGLERKLLEEASQKKADLSPPVCPVCGNPLSRLSHGHERTYQTRFGPVTIRRSRGWCQRCKAWRFAADYALGLEEAGSASPSVQEMAALMASKMPVAEASRVIEHLTGVKLPPATLDREARRQGQRAERKRKELDEQMNAGKGCEQCLPAGQRPFTLVIEIDAWNIRERDQWGQSEQQRAKGVEPERWHWVYGGTCFRLDQRTQTDSGRSIILSRGTVMTRGGIDALREQLFAECLRHGAGQADEVLVVADGAGVDLETGGRPVCDGDAAAGFLSRQPAPVGGGPYAASGGCAGSPSVDRAIAQKTQSWTIGQSDCRTQSRYPASTRQAACGCAIPTGILSNPS